MESPNYLSLLMAEPDIAVGYEVEIYLINERVVRGRITELNSNFVKIHDGDKVSMLAARLVAGYSLLKPPSNAPAREDETQVSTLPTSAETVSDKVRLHLGMRQTEGSQSTFSQPLVGKTDQEGRTEAGLEMALLFATDSPVPHLRCDPPEPKTNLGGVTSSDYIRTEASPPPQRVDSPGPGQVAILPGEGVPSQEVPSRLGAESFLVADDTTAGWVKATSPNGPGPSLRTTPERVHPDAYLKNTQEDSDRRPVVHSSLHDARLLTLEARFKAEVKQSRFDYAPLRMSFDRDSVDEDKADEVMKEFLRSIDQYNYAKKVKELSRLNQIIHKDRRIIQEHPGTHDLAYNIGCFLLELGKYPEALSSFEAALEVRELPDALLNAAFASFHGGDGAQLAGISRPTHMSSAAGRPKGPGTL